MYLSLTATVHKQQTLKSTVVL